MTLQGNNQFLTDLDVRTYLRDVDPSKNKLLDDLEFGTEEIRTAMTLTVDAWNDEPPFDFGADLYSFPYRSALLKGTCAKLLSMAGHAFRRNKLKYNIGGGAISDQDKDEEYDGMAQKLWSEYLDWVRRAKRANNVMVGWGTI